MNRGGPHSAHGYLFAISGRRTKRRQTTTPEQTARVNHMFEVITRFQKAIGKQS